LAKKVNKVDILEIKTQLQKKLSVEGGEELERSILTKLSKFQQDIEA